MQATPDWFIRILLQVHSGKLKPFCFPNTEGNPYRARAQSVGTAGIQYLSMFELSLNYRNTLILPNLNVTAHGHNMETSWTLFLLLQVCLGRSSFRIHHIWMQGYINYSIKGIFILVFVGYASLRGLGAEQPFKKNIPRHQLDPFSSQLQKHVWMTPIPITQPSFQAYRSADTRFEDLHNYNHHSTASIHKRVNSPAQKLDFFPQLCWD